MADEVLGTKSQADVSLVFIGPTRSRTLNRIYRGKDKPANILTFPFGKNVGEILIDLSTARAEARLLVTNDPELAHHPLLAARLANLATRDIHFE